MEQPELDKNEEVNEEPSSVELSETETAAAPETSEQTETSGVGDTPSEEETNSTSDDTEVAAEVSSDDDDDVPAVDSDDEDGDDDDSDGEIVEEAGGLRRGQVILGNITRTTPNEIFVDLGEGREGIVPKREVELMSGKMLENMKEGAEIHVYVVNPHNHRGEIVLSINHAQEELDWRTAEEYLQSKEVYDGKIGGYNRGGLIVRFGRLRGFVPQSQIGDKRQLDIEGDTPEERYSGLVNNQISVKVMEVDRQRNRLILSERAAMREVRQRRKEALITELEKGEIRQGRVVSLENFGAFVDIGGAEGLVHITELAWKHITHPRQVLDVGQEVEVKVINVDESKNRIGLSIRQLKADPWDELATRFGEGALVRGTVTKLTKFGAFARVHEMDAIEGLIHISELSDERVEHPRDVVNKGDKLTLRVVKVDPKNRRLGLSLRRVNSAEYLDVDLKRAFLEEREEQEIPVADEPDAAVDEDETQDDAPDETPEETSEETPIDVEVEPNIEAAQNEIEANDAIAAEALEESNDATDDDVEEAAADAAEVHDAEAVAEVEAEGESDDSDNT